MFVSRLVVGFLCLSTVVHAVPDDHDFFDGDDNLAFLEVADTEEETQEEGMTFAELEKDKNDISKMLDKVEKEAATKITNDGGKLPPSLAKAAAAELAKEHSAAAKAAAEAVKKADDAAKVVVHDPTHEIVIPVHSKKAHKKAATNHANVVGKHVKKITAKHAKTGTEHAKTGTEHAAKHVVAAATHKAAAKAAAAAKHTVPHVTKTAAKKAAKHSVSEVSKEVKKVIEEVREAAAHGGHTVGTHTESVSATFSVSATLSVAVPVKIPKTTKEIFPKTKGTHLPPTPNLYPNSYIIPKAQKDPSKTKVVEEKPGTFHQAEYDSKEAAIRKAMETREGILKPKKAAQKKPKTSAKPEAKAKQSVPAKHVETHPGHKQAHPAKKPILHTKGGVHQTPQHDKQVKPILHTKGGIQTPASAAAAATRAAHTAAQHPVLKPKPVVYVNPDSGKAQPSVPVQVWNAANADLTAAIKKTESKNAAAAVGPSAVLLAATAAAAWAL